MNIKAKNSFEFVEKQWKYVNLEDGALRTDFTLDFQSDTIGLLFIL